MGVLKGEGAVALVETSAGVGGEFGVCFGLVSAQVIHPFCLVN